MLSDPRNGNTGALNKQETNLQSKKIKEDMYVDKTKKKKRKSRGDWVWPHQVLAFISHQGRNCTKSSKSTKSQRSVLVLFPPPPF